MLVANGPWSQHTSEWLGMDVPVFPLRGQIVHLAPPDGVPMPTHSIFHENGYVLPKAGGDLLVGTTEERAGFDAHPTMEAQNSILEAVIRIAPNVLDAPIRDLTACLRPYSLDEMPILGAAPGTESLYLSTGHGYKGITLAIISGKAMAQQIANGSSDIDISPFSPRPLRGGVVTRMARTDLTEFTASELAALIRERQVSPVEVTSHFLERIARYDGELRAFITTVPEQAMAEAHRAEAAVIAGEELGPLHGVPFGIKDLNSTKGIRTTFGSLLFGDNVPKNDDIVSERIRASGAIIVGKTNTPDFGWKGTTESTIAGPCYNPWDTTRTAGGSSGGSGAALAARLVPLCNGGDAGGSIRIPASFCGIYGIKPGAGRVPSDYTANVTWGGLSQNGPMSTNVRDSALLLDILAGPDPRDPRSLGQHQDDYLTAVEAPSVDGLRIAWGGTMDGQPTDPQVLALAQAGAEAFAELGASVDEDMPAVATDDAIWAFVTFMLTDLMIALGPAIEGGQGDFLPSMLLKWLTDAKAWPASRYAEALHMREWHRHWFDELFERYDVLALPHNGRSRVPGRAQPEVNRGPGRASVMGLHAVLPACQPYWKARRQHPLRLHRRGPPRRADARGTHGRGIDAAPGVRRVRGCASMGGAPPAGVPVAR